MTPLETAIRIALDAHAGETDKAGRAYILHRVHEAFRLRGPLAKSA